MKTTPLTHPYTRNSLRSLLIGSALCTTLQAVELQFTLTPTAGNRQLGTVYAPAGDINGDGVTDIAVSDPAYASSDAFYSTGIVYVVSGKDGSLLRAYQGDEASAQFFGASLAALDANGDGVTDLAIGSSGYANGAGAVRTYSGVDGSLISFATGLAYAQYGVAIANAGDQDGDGKEDLFVGAPMANSNRGAVYVQSGVDGSILRTVDSPVTFALFGTTVAALGDIDGDGKKDFAVGSPGARSGTINNAGKVSVVRSLDGAFVDKFGTATFSRFGQSLAPAADANGDGLADLLIGTYTGGVALLVSGTDLSPIRDLSIPTLPAFQPINVGGTVDYDEDGVADILIGSPALNQTVTPATGGSRIVSGVDGSTLFEVTTTVENSGLGSTQTPLPGYGFGIGENGVVDSATGGTGLAHLYYSAPDEPEPVADTDGDGVLDDVDAVINSILDAKLSILGLNTGVANRVDATGTSLADRFAVLGKLSDYRKPTQYLLAVTQLTVDLLVNKLVSAKEAAKVVASATVGVVLGVLRR